MMQQRKVSQRRACKEIGVSRSVMVYQAKQPVKDKPLIEAIKRMSEKYPRFGYRRIAVMLGWELGESINPKRVYRLWQQMNLQIPKKRPRRKRPGTHHPPV